MTLDKEELRKIRAELTYQDALSKLQLQLARIDEKLEDLESPALRPQTAVLFYRRYYQREREMALLRIELLDLPKALEGLPKKHELLKLSHPVPHDAASILRSKAALDRQKSIARRLQQLAESDPEWADLRAKTGAPKPKPPELVNPRMIVNSHDETPSLAGSNPLLSQYRSALKRGILVQLALDPEATDHDICRGLDADGGVELPSTWKKSPEDRLFAQAYVDPHRRRRVEIAISKVRTDLRRKGLLARR